MDRRTRREYLTLGGSAVVAGLAGCDSSGTTTDGGGEPTETTRSETTTKTENPEDLREVTVDEDWRYPRFDVQNTGATDNTGPTEDLEVRWEANLDGAIDEASPTIADGTLFIGTKNGIAYALDAATGKEIWSTEFGHSILDPAPIVDGSVYFTSDRIHSLDAETGEEEWVYSITAGNRGVPLVADGRVYCLSDPGGLHVLDAESGERLWKQPLGNVQDFMVYDDGVLYASFPEKTVAVDTKSGEQLWATSIPGKTNAGPAVFKDKVYAEGDKVFELDTGNGGSKSTVNIDNPTDTPNISDEYIASPVSIDVVDGISVVKDGKNIWEFKLRVRHNTTISGDYIYAGSFGGDMTIYDMKNKSTTFTTDKFSTVNGWVSLASNLAFVADRGRMVCLQEKSS